MVRVRRQRFRMKLGGKTYLTKSAVIKRTMTILRSTCVDTRIEGKNKQFLKDLFRHHPEAARKIGPGIRSIYVKKNRTFGTKEFKILRQDDQLWDISYKCCLTQPTAQQIFAKGCRHAICGQIQAFKFTSFASSTQIPCAITSVKVTKTDCHVDHHRPQFREIVSQFIQKFKVKVDKIKYAIPDDRYDNGSVVFEDLNLTLQFQKFHQQLATLRVVAAKANLRRRKS